MKRIIWAMLLILAGCNSDELDVPVIQDETVFNMPVPPGFSWNGISQDVLMVTITRNGVKSNVLDSTSLYLFDPYGRRLDAMVIAKGTACFNLRIPAETQKLLIKAPAINMEVECAADKRSLNLEVPEKSSLDFEKTDTDHDGLFDVFDESPNDREITANVGPYFLNNKDERQKNAYSTWYIFEDSWPHKGDYDFNDIVIAVSFSWSRGRDNFIKEINAEYFVSGESDKFEIGFELFEARGTFLIYLDNVIKGTDGDILRNNLTGNMFMLKSTSKDDNKDVKGEFSLDIDHRKLIDFVCVPFLYRKDNPHHQIRSFGAPPTVMQDMSLFNTGDDISPSQWEWSTGTRFRYPISNDDAFYRTRECYPWGIVFISSKFTPAREGVSITSSYPLFREWAESGGMKSCNWYNVPRL